MNRLSAQITMRPWPTLAEQQTDVAPRGSTVQSLRDDELQDIADATYRTDYPLRFECVRQAALIFERAGYTIARNMQVSALTTISASVAIGALTIDPSRRVVRYDLRPSK